MNMTPEERADKREQIATDLIQKGWPREKVDAFFDLAASALEARFSDANLRPAMKLKEALVAELGDLDG